jgi:hypothetical protein
VSKTLMLGRESNIPQMVTGLGGIGETHAIHYICLLKYEYVTPGLN